MDPRTRRFLGDLEAHFDWPRHVAQDPIADVLSLGESQREVGGLIAAQLAFGNVASLRGAVQSVFERLERQPRDFLLRADRKGLEKAASGFIYRWVRGADLARLLAVLKRALEAYGDLGASFQTEGGEGPLRERARQWVGWLRSLDTNPPTRGFQSLLPSLEGNGAGKKWMLYLRWMVRHPPPDLGLWRFLDPAELIIPLDTHMARIGRNLGWTSRKSSDLKCAMDITRALRKIDPADPTRYDFPISHLGISRQCPPSNAMEKGADLESCRVCGLQPICRLAEQALNAGRKKAGK